MPSLESSDAWCYIEERFGVKENDLEEFVIKKVSGDFWLCSELETDLETETEGFRFIRETGRGLKPTTYALQFLGQKISKNKVILEKNQLLDLLNKERMIPYKLDEEGYVALEFKSRVIGCGFYKDNLISSRVPEGRADELIKILTD